MRMIMVSDNIRDDIICNYIEFFLIYLQYIKTIFTILVLL